MTPIMKLTRSYICKQHVSIKKILAKKATKVKMENKKLHRNHYLLLE